MAEKILGRVAGCGFDIISDQYGSYMFKRLLLKCTTQEQLEKIAGEASHVIKTHYIV